MAEEYTAKFKVDISDLKKNITEANKQIKLANATFKSETAGMEKWSENADGVSKKLAELKSVLQSQKSILASYEAELERTQKAYQENGSRADQLKAKLQQLTDQGVKKSDEEYKKYQEALKKVVSEQDRNEKAIDSLKISILNEKAAIGNTEKQIGSYDKQLSEMTGESKSADKATEDLGKSAEDAGEKANKSSGGWSVLKGVIADLAASVIKAAASALKDLGKQVMETGMNFESSMQNVAALSGATEEELKLLTDTAREYGATTQFSASEAADALGYMALAGWDAEKSARELGGVLKLAAASGMDLAAASDMVTDYLAAFSESEITAAEFADLLAYAQANSNTSAVQLGEAYKNSAASLNAAGQDVQTVTALLATMANQGLKGSEAGTALAAVMRDITDKMEDGAITIGETSVAVTDSEGNFRDLTEILRDVEAATNGMGTAERAAAISSTFTSRSLKGLNLILNDGVETVAEFEEELRNSTGAAGEMATIMQDNLSGDVKAMNSAFEELQLTLYDTAKGPIRDMVQIISKDLLPAITGVINGSGNFSKVSDAIKKMAEKAVSSIMKLLPDVAKLGAELLIVFVTSIVDNLPLLVNTALSIVMTLVRGLLSPENIQKLVDAAFQIVTDLVTFLSQNAKELITAAVSIVLALVKALTDPQNIGLLVSASIDLVLALVDGILSNLQPIIQAMPGLILAISQGLIENAPKLIVAAVQIIMALVDALMDPELLLELAKAALQIIIGLTQALFSAENMRRLWDAGVSIVSRLHEGIKEKIGSVDFSALWSKLKDGASKAWEGVKSVFSSVGSWFSTIFSNAWQKVKDVFSKGGQVFSGIKEGIETSFKKIVNTLIDGINKVVTVPFDALNRAIRTLKSTNILGVKPFQWMNELSVPQIPHLATGAVLKRGQVGLLEGSGAEAVVPLEKNKAWIRAVAKDMSQAVNAAGPTSNSNVTNYTQNIYSPKAPSRLELYRQTRNLLNYAGARA